MDVRYQAENIPSWKLSHTGISNPLPSLPGHIWWWWFSFPSHKRWDMYFIIVSCRVTNQEIGAQQVRWFHHEASLYATKCQTPKTQVVVGDFGGIFPDQRLQLTGRSWNSRMLKSFSKHSMLRNLVMWNEMSNKKDRVTKFWRSEFLSCFLCFLYWMFEKRVVVLGCLYLPTSSNLTLQGIECSTFPAGLAAKRRCFTTFCISRRPSTTLGIALPFFWPQVLRRWPSLQCGSRWTWESMVFEGEKLWDLGWEWEDDQIYVYIQYNTILYIYMYIYIYMYNV